MNLGETASFSALWASYVMPSIICQHKKKTEEKGFGPTWRWYLGGCFSKSTSWTLTWQPEGICYVIFLHSWFPKKAKNTKNWNQQSQTLDITKYDWNAFIQMNYSWQWLAPRCREQSEPFQAATFTSFFQVISLINLQLHNLIVLL